MTQKCEKHPQYKAVHKPRATCAECWRIYVLAHPDETFTSADMFAAMKSEAADALQKMTEMQEHIESMENSQLEKSEW